ncbi:hypothetical protein PAHAL_2G406400 [Panicum hallii]|uniref:F-box domain-containing protein n=1 Tax=Panicum hallii TaxID=206008 RepID=A0A2S3H3I3_9POAL|nr:hypothetical protein PAHAL_2G406400 [Panicum hallii]
MALPPRPDGRLPEAPAPPVDGLTDDLLAAILIRLPTLADFGRAAAACPAFRRVIADPAFLRRVRALHPSLLLGFLTFTGGFRPAEPPYASVPAARAVARAADFSYSFLPRPSGWVVRNARDGRVLLDWNDGGDGIFTKLAVCDPLFRRYVVLPPIPEDLAAAVQQPHLLDLERKFQVFLVPSDQEAAQTSFRVLWMAQCPTKLVSFIFSSVSGQWHAVVSPTWKDLDPAKSRVTMTRRLLYFRSYAYGCFYWMMMSITPNFLVLDMARMEFSLLKYPSHFRRLGMFSFNARFGESFELDIFSTVRPNQGEGANEWKTLRGAILPYQYRYRILGVVNTRLLIQGDLEFVDEDFLPPNVGVLSIALNTDYERVCGMIDEALHPLPLIGYPPSLSSPSI